MSRTAPALPQGFLDRPIAHRAFHGAGRPENSASAIRAAIEAGYGIEIDVRASHDGAAMVIHDAALDRLTRERGLVASRDAAALQALQLIGSADTIPTLEQVLDLIAGQVPLLIEIKDHDYTLGPNVGVVEPAVARALEGYAGPVAVMSFNPHAVSEMARLAPDLPRGLVTCAFEPEDWPDLPARTAARLREIPDYDNLGASFISHEVRDLDRPRVAELQAQGAKILCWTTRSPEEEAAARRIADNVTFEGYLPGPATA
ncbi:glycerophosphodiester phosphodiesterase family protein [Limimaricola sp. G21655-S1]|uniref:glycerophosphodiester phosphodiesterase family protein n=1 Tax=Limimaricola sp. G21655-S1 TaxID=3014768 RepID=UPI0022AF99ED|nr:glycerophosphodiester phosphodiesterase family protein [Limimaricola sp. G21655-S1]MCZ4261490.1 glycerophosphodiester phosphodiesterase family protein [Limimaricola sp. G21655-S1]